MTISFKVIGQPQSKARPRFANGHIYTPKGTKVYEADVKKAYLAVAQGYYFKDGPVSLVITAYLKRAKSNRRKFATTKPDICLLYTSPSPRDSTSSRMPSSA